MGKYKLLIVSLFTLVLGFTLGAATASAAVLGTYMSSANPSAPTVTVSCVNDRASVKFEMNEESSLNWYKFQKLNSTDFDSHSQSPNTTASIAISPVEPGIYTLVSRQITNFEVDSMPDDGRIMAYRVIYVPNCSK